MSRGYYMRMQSRIAADNAAATSNLLAIKRLEERERFIDGVVESSAVQELRSSLFANDVAAAFTSKETRNG